jgi:hypothetical protein
MGLRRFFLRSIAAVAFSIGILVSSSVAVGIEIGPSAWSHHGFEVNSLVSPVALQNANFAASGNVMVAQEIIEGVVNVI